MSPIYDKSLAYTSVSSAEEQYILTKLKELKLWTYSIKDIQRTVFCGWECPECGETKPSLLATAAHARDEHVLQIGSGPKYGRYNR